MIMLINLTIQVMVVSLEVKNSALVVHGINGKNRS